MTKRTGLGPGGTNKGFDARGKLGSGIRRLVIGERSFRAEWPREEFCTDGEGVLRVSGLNQ